MVPSVRAQERAAYQQRVDRLRAVVEQLRHLEARADSIRQGAPLDTIRRGTLMVVTTPNARTAVAEAVDSAWMTLGGYLRDDSGAVSVRPVFITPTNNRRIRPPRPPEGMPVAGFFREARASEVARQVVAAVETDLASRLDEGSQRWMSGRIPLETSLRTDWRRTYVRLVTTPSKAVRECYFGSISACEDALGFRRDSNAVFRWYDANEQRALVDRMEWSLQRIADPAEVTRCTVGAAPDVCTRLVRLLPLDDVQAPLTNEARRTLTSLALEMGGPGALGRLIAGPGPVERRLAAAAGQSIDSVVTAWHTAVIDSAPPAPIVHRKYAWAAFLWVVAFVVVATRSSRWRAT